MAAPRDERRKTDRRFTDREIEEILEYSRGYVNGAKQREKKLGLSVATLLALTTLINYWIMSPLKESIAAVRHEMTEVELSVRKHFESQALDYVLKRDYEKQDERVAAELAALRRMVERIVENNRIK